MTAINIKDFVRGWIVGDFSPCLVQTKDVEVAIMERRKAYKPDGHYHTQSTEYNFLVAGRAISNGRILEKGDCFVHQKNEKCEVEFLEDSTIIVVRTPSINDKVEA